MTSMITELTVTIAIITAMTDDVVSESVLLPFVSGGALSVSSARAEDENARKRETKRIIERKAVFLIADTAVLL